MLLELTKQGNTYFLQQEDIKVIHVLLLQQCRFHNTAQTTDQTFTYFSHLTGRDRQTMSYQICRIGPRFFLGISSYKSYSQAFFIYFSRNPHKTKRSTLVDSNARWKLLTTLAHFALVLTNPPVKKNKTTPKSNCQSLKKSIPSYL